MATIKGVWTDGESKLIHDDSALPKEPEWVDGEAFLISEYAIPAGGVTIPVFVHHQNQMRQ